MSNYDEEVRFEQGSDSGEDEAASIQPIGGSETYHATVLGRPPEHLRARTEVLRKEVRDLKYFADYDRAVTLVSSGTFKVFHAATGPDLYTVIATQDLWLYPALSPGKTSGGRARGARLFVAGVEGMGTLGVNDLHVTADRAHCGQRGYADGTDLADGQTLTVGANDVSVEFVAEARTGGAGSVQIAITGTPVRHIRVAWGTQAGGTTVNDVIATVNADRSSQGTYGAADYIFLSTTSPGTSTTVPTCAPTVLQGGYDAEAHRVTAAQLADFFATTANQLRDGETLALNFAGPVEIGAGAKGGRRQALHDLPTDRVGGFTDNTTPAVGNNLFNSGREPEKIPGALPIGKMINGAFVFVNGTTLIGTGVAVGQSSAPVSLGESEATLVRLGSTAGTTGAANIGYATTAAWHPDDGTAIAATQLQAAVDEIQSDLANESPGTSGARKIGSEQHAASPSAGNAGLALDKDSVRAHIADLLNTAGSSTTPGGINARVSEFGHRMHGPNPISKDLRESAPEDLTVGGGELLRLVTNNPGNSVYPVTAGGGGNGKEGHAVLVLEPFVTNLSAGGGTGKVLAEETVAAPVVAGAGKFNVTTQTLTEFTNTMRMYARVLDQDAALVKTVVCQLKNTGPTDGYYFVSAFDFTNKDVTVVKLNGAAADLSAATYSGSSCVSFYTGSITGTDKRGTRLRAQHVNADGPMVVIGTPQANPISPYKLLDVYRAAVTNGNAAIKVAEYHADHAIWREYQTNDATNVVRHTQNILVAGDKALLDGVETSVVVDASASHHHDGRYSLRSHTNFAHDPNRRPTGDTSETPSGNAFTYNGDTQSINVLGTPNPTVAAIAALTIANPSWAVDTVFWYVPANLRAAALSAVVTHVVVQLELKLFTPSGGAGVYDPGITGRMMSVSDPFTIPIVLSQIEQQPIETFSPGQGYTPGGAPAGFVVRSIFYLPIGNIDPAFNDAVLPAVGFQLTSAPGGGIDATISTVGVRFLGVMKKDAP